MNNVRNTGKDATRSRLLTKCLWIAAMTLLLAPPLLTAWNLAATERAPRLVVSFGPKLGGVVNQTPLEWSWKALTDGSLNKAVTERIATAMPLRPILVRVNNEIRQTLFGQYNAPGVIEGKNGQLIEESYLREYCALTEGAGLERGRNVAGKLREIQDAARKRGAIFVYLITPSKAAHMPEAFAGRLPCPGTQTARTQFLPDYVRTLREGGIAVTDTASLIHSLKGKFEVDLFPQGGVHWNEIGRNEAAKLIVEDINRQAEQKKAKEPLLPSFAYTYTVSNAARGSDRELIDVINVLFPALSYPVPTTSLQPQANCTSHPARQIDAVAIGSSFLHAPAEVLISAACLAKLNVYFYMSLSRHGGTPYRPLQQNPTEADLAPLKTAEIVILEENESFAGTAGYIDRLWELVAK